MKFYIRIIFLNAKPIKNKVEIWFPWLLTLCSYSGVQNLLTDFSLFTQILALLLISILISVTLILNESEREIYSCGTGAINVMYGDLFKIAADNSTNKIIVIPFNTCFDTIVDDDLLIDKPLVSAKTVHGQWLNRMQKLKINIEASIFGFLEEASIKPDMRVNVCSKPRGNRYHYKQGTIAVVRGQGKSYYYLCALSEFDNNNIAHCEKDELVTCIKELLVKYNRAGQGYDLYVPLMGTGLSRTNCTHKDALLAMVSTMKLNSEKIKGKITIVIYTGDRDKVSIYDC